MIVEGNEWLREIFDGWGRLSIAGQTTIDLHTIPAFVDAKKASHDHISFGILGDNLQAELNGVDFMAHKRTKMLDPIEETLLPVIACV